MSEKSSAISIGMPGRLTIGRLLVVVFSLGLLVAAALIYAGFSYYRQNVASEMAQAEGRRVAELMYENLYSVMRKGASRSEIDQLIEGIQSHLPEFKVSIVRGEPVARQFGERPGQAELRQTDARLAPVFASGQDYSGTLDGIQRYLLPVRVTEDCLGCHTAAQAGDINGVIDVSVSLAMLEAPITRMAHPMIYLALGLLGALLLTTYLVLRAWVSRPIQELAYHVTKMFRARDYSHNLHIGQVWPKEVRSLAANFNLLMRQIRSSQEKLREISLHDPLTGLFNRRHFDAALAEATIEAERSGRNFAVLLLDLDGFKPVNDRHGHAAGDALLVGVGKALSGSVRDSEIAARIGGDEFAVIAFVDEAVQACELSRRLREAIAASTVRVGAQQIAVTCSIGVAIFPGNGRQPADLLHAADQAMYEEKQGRRRASPEH